MVKAIGLCGEIGCGKGTVADYLVNKNRYHMVAIGDLVRAEVISRGLGITRDNTDAVSKEMTGKYGMDYWLKTAAKKIRKNNWKKVIIDGIRYPNDVEFFGRLYGGDFILVYIKVSAKTRFKRLIKRKRPGFPKTYKRFLEHEKRQDVLFRSSKTFKMADYKVNNGGTLDRLHKEVKKLIKKLGKDWE